MVPCKSLKDFGVESSELRIYQSPKPARSAAESDPFWIQSC